MLFFVMSGFLVGSKYLPGTEWDGPRFRTYAIDRLTRIWVVLVPAVLVSAAVAWALIGIYGYAYSGTTARCAPGLGDILATLAFLNEGYLDTVCSNEPAWSIHSEVHYYFMWPALIFLLGAGNPGRVRIISALFLAVTLGGLIWRDTIDIKNTLILAPIWVAGVFVLRVPVLRVPMIGLCAALAVAMVAPSIDAWERLWPISDYLIGLAALLVFAQAVRLQWVPSAAVALENWLAKISYSLYLTHIIVIGAVRTVLEQSMGRAFPINAFGGELIVLYLGLVLGCVVFALAFYMLFEAQTARLRRVLAPRWRALSWCRPGR